MAERNMGNVVKKCRHSHGRRRWIGIAIHRSQDSGGLADTLNRVSPTRVGSHRVNEICETELLKMEQALKLASLDYFDFFLGQPDVLVGDTEALICIRPGHRRLSKDVKRRGCRMRSVALALSF